MTNHNATTSPLPEKFKMKKRMKNEITLQSLEKLLENFYIYPTLSMIYNICQVLMVIKHMVTFRIPHLQVAKQSLNT
jgi:hypothetical protein